MTKAFLVLTLLSLLFSGCTLPENTPATVLAPVVTVSSDVAKAGEFVDVTVTSGVTLTEFTTMKEDTVSRVVVGLCFIPSEKLVGSSDEFCEALSLPNGFLTEDDMSLLSTERTITVKRGETIEINHHIRLTATEARGVTLIGYVGALDNDDEPEIFGYGIEGKRTFVAFQ